MNTKFKVGDRVRKIGNDQYGTPVWPGDEGVITEAPKHDDYRVRMETGTGAGHRWYLPESLLEAAPPREFQVGDRVRMVADSQFGAERTRRGDEAVVVAGGRAGYRLYNVEMTSGNATGTVFAFQAEHLELAQPASNGPETYRAGELEPWATTDPVTITRTYTPTPEHLADIKAISERLQAEAEQREWCEDYNEVVEDLNQRLTVTLDLMTSDYTVVIQGENYGSDLYSDTQEEVTVTATSEDDAVAKVAEIVQKYLRGELIDRPGS